MANEANAVNPYPVFVRTKHDKVVGVFVLIATLILVTLIMISVIYYPASAGQ
jgi:hypothetical protein